MVSAGSTSSSAGLVLIGSLSWVARPVPDRKCATLRCATAIRVPCGLTPGAQGSSEASLTNEVLRVVDPTERVGAGTVASSPIGTVPVRWTVIRLARPGANPARAAAAETGR